MRRLLLAMLLCCLVAPSSAQAVAIGFGEQSPTVFANEWWQKTKVKRMHYLTGWDALRVPAQRDALDAWLAAARTAGVEPVVSFGVSSRPKLHEFAPSPETFRRLFFYFRERYPEVTNFVTWNEANHCSQPVCKRPGLVARYYDAMVRTCPECKIAGADVLDSPSMASFVEGFKAAVKTRPRIWGLHNYLDANRLRTSGTRTLLRMTTGAIWLTETGGLVRRSTSSPIEFPQSVSHQKRVTWFLLNRLVPLSPRIKRVYLYHFLGQDKSRPWDSGFLSPWGKPRPAYKVLRRYMARVAAARRSEAR